jgi:hypothetical protein
MYRNLLHNFKWLLVLTIRTRKDAHNNVVMAGFDPNPAHSSGASGNGET